MKTYFITCLFMLAARGIFGQSGAFDTTFGTAGQVFTTVNNSGIANGVAVQTDGRIIAVGTAILNSGNAFAMVRYTPNGYLDGTFGGVGILTMYVGPSSGANCVLLQPDGKIVVAGRSENLSGNYDFTLARMNTDGGLDSTFGVDGIEITDLGKDDEVTAINIQKDGKLVAAGFSKSGDSVLDVALVRYNTDGSMDSAFGNAGIVLTPVILNAGDPAPLQKPDCKLQADGKIVVVTTAYHQTNDFVVLRYNMDGTPDNTFGSNGQAGANFGGNEDYGYAVAVQPDGKIIAGGLSVTPGVDSGYTALARFNTDGSLDDSFGISGRVMSMPVLAGGADVRALAVQPNGAIITAGTEANVTLPRAQQCVVAKFKANGMADDSFGRGGYVTTLIENDNVTGTSMALQPDGKIVIAGGDGQQFITARLLNFADSVTGVDTTGDTIPAFVFNASYPAAQVTVYPNPTQGHVTVQYALTNNDNVTIKLWDLSGQLIGVMLNDAERLPGVQKENINLSALAPGYYMLSLSTSAARSTIKLLKQ